MKSKATRGISIDPVESKDRKLFEASMDAIRPRKKLTKRVMFWADPVEYVSFKSYCKPRKIRVGDGLRRLMSGSRDYDFLGLMDGMTPVVSNVKRLTEMVRDSEAKLAKAEGEIIHLKEGLKLKDQDYRLLREENLKLHAKKDQPIGRAHSCFGDYSPNRCLNCMPENLREACRKEYFRIHLSPQPV